MKNLTSLQKQGIISLIPKPDKDLTNISNWRPISLLNVDYKLARKTIANPINYNKLNRSGVMKYIYIGENITLIFKVIEYLQKANSLGLLFFADYEKAFNLILFCT